jgi:hypothetical protein
MVFKLSGKYTTFRFVQPKKAFSSILVKPSFSIIVSTVSLLARKSLGIMFDIGFSINRFVVTPIFYLPFYLK